MKESKTIAVLGLWHLGLVTAVGLSELGFSVIGFDKDKEKITRLNMGEATIFEPKLAEYLKKNIKNKHLNFTSSLADLQKADIFYLTFDTPLNDKDEVDLSGIFDIIRKLKNYLPNNALVIVSSQIPLGTTEKIKTIFNTKEKNIEIAYIPENLRLGIAWKRFMHPAMLVIGTQKQSTYRKILNLYKKIKTPKIWVNVRTAEMVKHAINAFLATSISFANEMGNLSEMTGVDFNVVAKILKKDERIGHFARINPGLGFSGGTLARDLRILQELGQKYKTETTLINSVLTVNEWQKKWVVRKLKRIFNNTLKDKTISILGLTYTPQTSTLRRSLSLETINDLVNSGAKVRGYDPKADRRELARQKNFQLAESFESLVKDSDALVLMTEWNDFLKLEWPKAAKMMRRAIVLDPKNFLNNLNLAKMGYIYMGIGRGNYETV